MDDSLLDDSLLGDQDDTVTNVNDKHSHHQSDPLSFSGVGAGAGAGVGVGVGSSARGSADDGVSPLEQEVLGEYERLVGNMDKLSETLASLASGPITVEIADNLRLLERKVTSVYTLMKASVYSIVLQQGQVDAEGEDGFGNGTTVMMDDTGFGDVAE